MLVLARPPRAARGEAALGRAPKCDAHRPRTALGYRQRASRRGPPRRRRTCRRGETSSSMAAEGNALRRADALDARRQRGASAGGRAVRRDRGARRPPVPPTINALLSARLDRLAAEERAVVEPASVIGVLFACAAVQELAPGRSPGRCRRASRRSRRAVRADAPEMVEKLRFNHVLIRDAAYNGLLNEHAPFHERFVEWADRFNRNAAASPSSRRSSATTSSRHTGTSPSWAARRPRPEAGPPCGGTPHLGCASGVRARRHARRGEPVPPRDRDPPGRSPAPGAAAHPGRGALPYEYATPRRYSTKRPSAPSEWIIRRFVPRRS